MIKWALIVAGVIVLLVAIVQVVGMMIPLTHTASRSARIGQRPETIYATIIDWRSFPSWRSDLKSVRERDSTTGHISWIEVSKMGELPFELIELEAPSKVVSQIADPEHKLPFGGTWTWRIEPVGADGSIVTITENGEIRPAMFRFMARFIFGYTSTMESYLKALEKKFAQSTREGEAPAEPRIQ